MGMHALTASLSNTSKLQEVWRKPEHNANPDEAPEDQRTRDWPPIVRGLRFRVQGLGV